MNEKKIPSPRVSAKEGNGVLHTSSECKDTHFLRIDKPLQLIKNQNPILRDAFYSNIITRFQAERLTGIRTSSICQYVARQRERNAIWSCGIHKDKYTGRWAEHLTMNLDLAVDYYKNETAFLSRDLPTKGQDAIVKAIRAYLQRMDFGVFISSALDDCDREVWLRIQDYIDLERKAVRSANAERKQSIYQDL